jgi:hypothetical protein
MQYVFQSRTRAAYVPETLQGIFTIIYRNLVELRRMGWGLLVSFRSLACGLADDAGSRPIMITCICWLVVDRDKR